MFTKDSRVHVIQTEVCAGTTLLTLNSEGEIQRITAVVAVHLQREEDGRFLVQLGKWRDGRVEATCTLPGTKYERKGPQDDILNHILTGQLAPFRDGMFE